MKKKKAIIINLIVILIALNIFMGVEGAGLTPSSAHKKQERTVNYGPSQTIAVIAKDRERFFLAQFKNYYSCDVVKKGFLGLWYGSRVGSPWGIENKKEKVVNYNINAKRDIQNNEADSLAVFGILNEEKENVVSLNIEVLIQNREGKFITEEIKVNRRGHTDTVTAAATDGGIYEDMFVGFIEREGMEYFYVKKISAFDHNGQLLFKEIDENAAYIEQNKIVY